MRRTALLSFVAALMLMLVTGGAAVQAQNIEFEWLRWDASINVIDDNTVEVAEAQEYSIISGSVRRVNRVWTDPVEIQSVFVVDGDGDVAPLSVGSGETPGIYTLSESGDETSIVAYLPAPLSGGDTFLVQINYRLGLPADGILDWNVIPDTHGATIRSSTVNITFPNGQAPTAGLVRVTEGNGTVAINGNVATITAVNIPADQPLGIQAPFGAGVGAAGGVAANNQAVQPQPTVQRVPANTPTGAENVSGIDLGSILPILCIIGVIIVLGGGRGIIGSLIGMFLGGGLGGGRGGQPGGGIFGGGGGSPGGGIFGGGGSSGGSPGGGIFGGGRSSGSGSSGGSRGFRQSSGGRSVPTVRNNKKGGGSAGLG